MLNESKKGYEIILETKSFPGMMGVTVIVIFPKALFLLGAPYNRLPHMALLSPRHLHSSFGTHRESLCQVMISISFDPETLIRL